MNAQLLKLLLTDRELGELPSETAALLEAYLERDPAAAELARTFSLTLQLARQTLSMPPAPPLRPLDVERLQRSKRAVWLAPQATFFGKLAACLAVGLTVGWFAHSAQQRATPAVSSPEPPLATSSEAFNPSAQYWTVAHLARR